MTSLRDFDLNLLITLDVLLEELNLTRAADRLGVSQPTVSVSLNKLRRLLQDDILVRSGATMRATERALGLRKPVRDILTAVRNEVLLQSKFDPAQDVATFSLSMSDIGELEFLPNLLKHIAREAPRTTITSVVVPPNELERKLEEGEVDLCLGYFPDLSSAAIQQQLLFEHRFATIVKVGHPLLGNEGLTLDNFLKADHAVVQHPARRKDLFERALEAQKLERRVILKVPNYMSIPFIVEESDLMATLPRPLANKFAKFCRIEVLEPPVSHPPIEVKQLWHRRHHHSPRLLWLRTLVRELCQNQPYL